MLITTPITSGVSWELTYRTHTKEFGAVLDVTLIHWFREPWRNVGVTAPRSLVNSSFIALGCFDQQVL